MSAAICLLTFVWSPQPASASHPYTDFYNARWRAGVRENVYIWHGSTISGEWASRASDGAKVWDAVGTAHNFVWRGQADFPAVCAFESNINNVNLIYRGGLDGPYNPNNNPPTGTRVATTKSCALGDEMFRYHIKFDIEESWHTGTTTGGICAIPYPSPTCVRYDAFSVTTHEFGHATGWAAHFDDLATYSGCANNSSQQTMCSTIYPGTTRMRDLASHDLSAFNGAY